MEDVKAKRKGFAPGNEMYLSSGGELYVKKSLGACDGSSAKLYRGNFTETGLEFAPIEGADADFFAEDSEGRVYAVKDGRNGGEASLKRVDEGGEAIETAEIGLSAVESLRVIGDDVFVTGRDEEGRDVFLRHGLADGDETDLLGGNDLVVQDYQVNAEGDVYFGAVDLTDAAERKLFRYDSTQGILEPVTALPEDLKEIIFIGSNGLDQFGMAAE